MEYRIEKDAIGERQIPAGALFGIHAARAFDNFPDRTPFHEEWYRAMGLVKLACYLTVEAYGKALAAKLTALPENWDPGLFKRMPFLVSAARQVADGEHFGWFIVPAFSGGAGTSINMNVNEIVTNLALLDMGGNPGDYGKLDPILDANIFQSTNDVVPTALRVATMNLLTDLEKEINALRFSVEQAETGHLSDIRTGYTQMQEAVPTSFGKLFSTYSEALSRDWWRVSKCFERIKLVNLGGSAIGTGLTVPRFFIMEVVGRLQELTGLPVARSENMADATSNLDSFVEIHAILKAHAVNLEKMVSDLRLLASDLANPSGSFAIREASQERPGPMVTLPRVQVGSSVMPGKINPVVPEFIISAAHRVYANDQLIASLCGQGCLELNAYLPVIGHALLESLKLLIACNRTALKNLWTGLAVGGAVAKERLMYSPSIATALLPLIGYHRAADAARYMKENGCDILAANQALSLVPAEKLEQLLQPGNLLKLGFTLDDIGGISA